MTKAEEMRALSGRRKSLVNRIYKTTIETITNAAECGEYSVEIFKDSLYGCSEEIQELLINDGFTVNDSIVKVALIIKW